MEDRDREILEKLTVLTQTSVTESGAIQFLALLSLSEYDRLIDLFEQGQHDGLSVSLRRKLIIILKKLRMAKGGR